MIKPITPNEVLDAKKIPDEVIKIFNNLIIEKWEGQSATIAQNEVVEKISNNLKICRQSVFNRGYLNIESLFRDFGWLVTHSKPDYNSEDEAFFVFKPL